MDRVIEMQVSGYQIRGGEALGAMGTGNAVLLRLSFDAAWEGLSKCAKFTDARGEGGITTEVELLTRSADGSYTVAVPREAMAYEGMAELSLVGELTESGIVTKRLTTKPLPLRIYASGADRKAQNTEPITATDKQQILAKVDVAESYARGTANGEPVPERAGDNAKYYKDQAGISAGKAAEAASAAETAQKDAEKAQSAAEAAKSEAEKAQKAAEEAGSTATAAATASSESFENAQKAEQGAEAAQKAAEASAAASAASAEKLLSDAEQLFADLNAHRYDAFAEDHMTAPVVRTKLGADNVPTKETKVTVRKTAGESVTLKVCNYGLNLFDYSTKPKTLDIKQPNGETVKRAGYELYLPAGYYFLSASLKKTGENVLAAVFSGDSDKTMTNIWTSAGGHPTVINGSGGTRWITAESPLDSNRAYKIKIDDGDVLYIFSPYDGSDSGEAQFKRTFNNIQVEFGSNVSYDASTPLPVNPIEDYVQPIEATVNYDADVTVTAMPCEMKTRKGVNNIFVARPLPNNVTQAVVVSTFRLDPTLVYEQLKAADVSAGTT